MRKAEEGHSSEKRNAEKLGNSQSAAMENVMEEPWQVDEVTEFALRGRRPRQNGHSATDTTTADNGGESSVTTNGSAEFNQEQNVNNKGIESTEGFPGLKDAIVDIVSWKTEILPVESTILPISKTSFGEQILPISSTDNGTTGHENLSLFKDVAELYLERVFEKPAAHEFYCPNCNSCIKKVILRGNEEGSSSAQSPEPVDTFIRCTSCFSFLIPIGNWFFPKLVPKEEDIQQETNTVQAPPPDSSADKSPSGGTLLGQNKPHSSDENTNASVINKVPPSVDKWERIDQISGTTDALEADRNNAASSKQDSKPLEVIIIRDRNVDAATEEKRKGSEAEPPLSRPIMLDLAEGTTDSEPRGAKKLEIVKSIVYGGLIESITSLSVVTSAASADAATLNIIALSLANLIGGVFTIANNLWDMKREQPRGDSSLTNEQVDRYQEVLGRRDNFILHATIALLSFLVFGLVPPVVYGFTFLESDDKNFKLAAVAVASLLCITILAIGKAYIQKPPKPYIKTVLNYLITGIMASGVSYIAGDLAKKLIEKLGWFNSGEPVTVPLAEMSSGRLAWASY